MAIARTLLRQPDIMLCDEVTSALDAETEASIVSALRLVNQDRTCVIVAHRLASVAHADCILVMKQGKVSDNTYRGNRNQGRRGGGTRIFRPLHILLCGCNCCAHDFIFLPLCLRCRLWSVERTESS